MINIIYGLRDPRNDVYQYIGKSTVGTKRAITHLTKSHSDKVNQWINELAKNWQYPLIDIIEEVQNIEDLIEREKYWINYYHNINPNLFNIQSIKSELQNIRSVENEKEFNILCNIVYEIPKILKKERLYRNLTQTKLADMMGVNRSTISFCENGGNINFKTICSYIMVLKGIDIVTKNYIKRPKKNIY
jgi:DNA-binding XRE family transcriptional regulator